MSREFGPKRTVRLAKIALSLKIQTIAPGFAISEYLGLRFAIRRILHDPESNDLTTLHPRIARYGKSIRGSNGLRIEIREIPRARDDTRTSKLARAVPPPWSTRHHTRGTDWVSKAIMVCQQIVEPRLQTPTLGKTPHLESLLFLDHPQKVTGNGSFERPKFRPNFKS